ncbi:MAG: response regulator [Betaproteobacteria bacterium]|jgi:DNA-binding response OmpR family regulator|nr:response regulator [Rhodoferax sp.]MCX7265632.1 response regulator [Burkholderiales bacterium]NBX14127.1 response regulator [Betaproteobacteria bacterium]NBX89587.1 response regulator [Betaproteobacteria bacterium]
MVDEKYQQLTKPFAIQPSAAQRRILIVDDDLQIGQALGAWFELSDYCIMQYSSGEGLLAYLVDEAEDLSHTGCSANSANSTMVGAVFDLNLPGMSGFELAQCMRVMHPQLPIVIITALNEEARRAYGTAPKGIACLQKPFELGKLEQTLFPTAHNLTVLAQRDER